MKVRKITAWVEFNEPTDEEDAIQTLGEAVLDGGAQFDCTEWRQPVIPPIVTPIPATIEPPVKPISPTAPIAPPVLPNEWQLGQRAKTVDTDGLDALLDELDAAITEAAGLETVTLRARAGVEYYQKLRTLAQRRESGDLPFTDQQKNHLLAITRRMLHDIFGVEDTPQ